MKIQNVQVKATNLVIDGVTQVGAVLSCTGDDTGGDAVWSAIPRTAGNSYNATTPNGYDCSTVAGDLTPGTTYDVSVTVNGVGPLTGVFTTTAETIDAQSGLQPLRRRSF